MTSDGELLRRYSEGRSEEAFAELVGRHLNLVYSAALRQVNEDSHLAEDVAQLVFTDLARKAQSLSARPALAGWLYTSTHFAATMAVRTERRRRNREQEAHLMHELLQRSEPDRDWSLVRPTLDAAMLELDESDREAVLLRYFENRPHAEIAERLGTSENTARMRVERALERLHGLLTSRGIKTTATLSAIISANAVQAAPVGLAVTISTAATLGGTIISTTIATHTTMNWLNFKSISAIIATAIAAGTATHLIQENEASRLRSENRSLTAQREELTSERDALASAAVANKDDLERLQNNQSELLRLRSDVGMLRKQMAELGKVHDADVQSRTTVVNVTQPSPPESNQANAQAPTSESAKLNTAKMFSIAMRFSASQNEQEFPTNLDQIVPYLGGRTNPVVNDLSRFEISFRGTMTNLPTPSSAFVIREKEAWQTTDGKWGRTYGFADGHSEIRYAADGDFSAWELEHGGQLPTNGK